MSRAVAATPLPALLRDAGYRMIHVGKAHFGAIGTPGADPTALGFDVDLADALTREAVFELERAHRDGVPFFLHLSHYAVHAPYEDDARFRSGFDAAGLPSFQATLASMVAGMDRSLGEVLAALDRLGLAEDTVVLFLSDNGSPSQCPRNLPLRGHKLSPYEGGVRVPMPARWPGVTTPGASVDAPVVVEDVFPTILAAAGVDWRGRTAQAVDGVSFAALLRGDQPAAARSRALVWHYPHHYAGQQPWSAIRVGDHKLVHHHADGRLELFADEAHRLPRSSEVK